MSGYNIVGYLKDPFLATDRQKIQANLSIAILIALILAKAPSTGHKRYRSSRNLSIRYPTILYPLWRSKVVSCSASGPEGEIHYIISSKARRTLWKDIH